MDIYIDDLADYQAVVEALDRCEDDDVLCCRVEAVFNLVRLAIQKTRRAGVTAQLIDTDGYVVRQLTSKKRSANRQVDQLNDKQIAVVRALEKVMGYCKAEGIQLIGYSDELVALPAGLGDADIASAAALAVEAQGVYRGVEVLDDHLDV